VRTIAAFPFPLARELAAVLADDAPGAVEATLRRFFFVAAGEADGSALPEQLRPRKHESARSQDTVPYRARNVIL
jgi:hypothetical protein